ncbi:MAG: hypothetical protein OXF02_06760 [Simkaniaceae bacterium]|nr:hypothetical protein [Simkaniaceae bacterium]
MVKEGIAHADPLITPMEYTDLAPTAIHQPAVAPAVAVNNVAQVRFGGYGRECIATGVMVGEALVGVGGTMGTAIFAGEIATRMGATFAVSLGIAVGATALVSVCALGCVVVTAGYYVATACE